MRLEVDILMIKSKVCGSEDNREEGDVGLWEGDVVREGLRFYLFMV